MELPEKGKYQESEAFYTWMGADGICRTVVKDGVDIDIKEAKINSEIVKSYDQGKKFPLIVDMRKIKSMDREAREFLSIKDRPSPVCCITLIISSPVSRVIGNFFIGLNKSRVPNKLFTNYEKALVWAQKEKKDQ